MNTLVNKTKTESEFPMKSSLIEFKNKAMMQFQQTFDKKNSDDKPWHTQQVQ